MYIEQSKLTDNVVKNTPNENNGMGIENFLIKNEEQSGFFANRTEEYSKENAVVNACGNVNMANATYQKPFPKEDKNEIDDNLTHGMVMTAENRMNQMVVASNTMTPEDYQKMQEDGFSFDNASSHTVITETDKIKAVLAKAGVEVFEQSHIKKAFAGHRKKLINSITKELLETEFQNVLVDDDLETCLHRVQEKAEAVARE